MVSAPPEQPAGLTHPQHTAVERIAAATGAPLEEVQRIYAHEISELQREARLTQFVGVIATRRVLRRLRGH